MPQLTMMNDIDDPILDNKKEDPLAWLFLLKEAFKNPSHGKIPLRGGGEPPFSVNFFPLSFLPAVVCLGGEGGTVG